MEEEGGRPIVCMSPCTAFSFAFVSACDDEEEEKEEEAKERR